MQITVRHNFQSTKPDSADGTLVQPSNWNEDHFVNTISDVTDVLSVFGRTGNVTAQAGDYNASQVTNAISALGNYADPPWITSLAWTKIQSPPAFIVDPLTTKGDLLVRSATANVRLPVGVDGLILMADSAAAEGVKWVAAGAGFQTPWLSNINAAGFSLTNAGLVSATNIRSTDGTRMAEITSLSSANLPGLSEGSFLASVGHTLNIAGARDTGAATEGVNISYFNGSWKRAIVVKNSSNPLALMPDEGNVGIGYFGVTSPWSKLTVFSPASSVSLTNQTPACVSFVTIDGQELSIFHDALGPNSISLQTRHSTVAGQVYPLNLNPLGGAVNASGPFSVKVDTDARLYIQKAGANEVFLQALSDNLGAYRVMQFAGTDIIINPTGAIKMFLGGSLKTLSVDGSGFVKAT